MAQNSEVKSKGILMEIKTFLIGIGSQDSSADNWRYTGAELPGKVGDSF
jgi:hypothetical protein